MIFLLSMCIGFVLVVSVVGVFYGLYRMGMDYVINGIFIIALIGVSMNVFSLLVHLAVLSLIEKGS